METRGTRETHIPGKIDLGMWEGFQDSHEKGRVLRFECVPQEFTGRNLILKFTY